MRTESILMAYVLHFVYPFPRIGLAWSELKSIFWEKKGTTNDERSSRTTELKRSLKVLKERYNNVSPILNTQQSYLNLPFFTHFHTLLYITQSHTLFTLSILYYTSLILIRYHTSIIHIRYWYTSLLPIPFRTILLLVKIKRTWNRFPSPLFNLH